MWRMNPAFCQSVGHRLLALLSLHVATLSGSLKRNSCESLCTMSQLYERISAVEDFVVMCNSKFDGFGKELGDLSTDVRTVLDWISQHFGTELECSRNRVHPQRIEIEIVTTPAPSSNTATVETNTDGPFTVGDPIFDSRNNIQRDIPTGIVQGDEISQVDDESVHSEAFDDGSDDIVPIPSPKPRRRAPPRNHRNSTGATGLSVNEDDTTEDSDHIVSSNLVDLINLRPSNTVPKRGRPCKPILQNKKAEPQPSQCDQCGKILKDAGSLRQHKATHKDVRPHVCPECGKAFRRKFHLKTHSLIHSGEKKHQCGYCGKLFLLPKDLVAHERIHTGERPYSCTFSQSNSLRVHKKVHLKNQNNAASAGKELASSLSTTDVTSACALSTTSSNINNNNSQYQPVGTPLRPPQQHSQGRPSTSRESSEPVIFEVDHHQNVYNNSVPTKNGQLPQETAASHLRTAAAVPSHHSLISTKSYHTENQMQSANTAVSKSGDQLVSSIRSSSLSFSNDRSHILVPNTYQTPRDSENENDKYF
ncbi:unnamed protein product [Allacma fusca]|uniref:C2H2-type domain-containing protein n=1 Tax=Allacma fusca TaxID=39272 RepID=A0A8J2LFD9_9HEXA|nr:unnamed protein product [Allacma fusca]